MANWVGGLPHEPKANEEKKAKKAAKLASPTDGDHPKTFYGGAIPPIPPKLPKYKKEEPPPKVKITGAGIPIAKDDPKPTVPSVTPPPTPPTPSLPPPPPPSPVSEPTSQSYSPPPPPPPPVSEPTLQSYSPPPPPTRFPSVFDKKPKKKRKKKPKPPPPPKPVQCDDVCGDQGEENVGKLASIFAICHIPATRQYSEDSSCVSEKEDRSGFASRRSGGDDDDDDGPDIPPEVPSYMRPEKFSTVFGKKIDARNIAEAGPHGWHPSANAPHDITDTSDTITVSPSGWHEPRSE